MTEALTRLGLPTSANIRPSDEWDIIRAAADRAKCDGCAKTPEQSTDCYQTFVRLDEYGEVIISCGYCPKAKAFLLQRKIDRLTKSSGIGGRFAKRRFETFKPVAGTEEALKICRKFCMNFSPEAKGIRLIGSYGCGKTHLAAAILNELCGRGVAGMFIVVPDYLQKRKAAFDDKAMSSDVRELAEMAKTVPILVLDDLGAEKATDWVREELFLVINARYERELPTIITTNCPLGETSNQLGQRIASRLVEMTTAVTVNAGDYRQGGQMAWGKDVAPPPF